MRKTLAVDLVAALLILLFLYTALSKIVAYSTFKLALQKSLLIKNFAGWLAWLLPVSEIFISVLLFIPLTKRIGLIVACGTLVLFTVYLLYMISFSPSLPCTCGGVLKEMTWPQHVFFNCFFIALAITGIVLTRNNKKPKPYSLLATSNLL